MLVYKDMISGEEIISDSFKIVTVDDTVYEVDGKFTTKGSENYETGANPSAEEQEEALDETSKRVVDIVEVCRLVKCEYDRKSYIAHLKGYMKRLKEILKERGTNEEDIRKFETNTNTYSRKIIQNFKDYEFYTAHSDEDYRMVVLLNYREDGMTPYLTIWKDGIVKVKV